MNGERSWKGWKRMTKYEGKETLSYLILGGEAALHVQCKFFVCCGLTVSECSGQLFQSKTQAAVVKIDPLLTTPKI